MIGRVRGRFELFNRDSFGCLKQTLLMSFIIIILATVFASLKIFGQSLSNKLHIKIVRKPLQLEAAVDSCSGNKTFLTLLKLAFSGLHRAGGGFHSPLKFVSPLWWIYETLHKY